MRVRLSKELAGKLSAAWSVVTALQHREHAEFRSELEAVQERMQALWSGRSPAEIPVLQPARQLYRAAGMDPTRMRPSSEALLRRVLQGKGLYRLDPIVDTGNLFSLAESLPLGLYDLDHIEGDVSVRLGREGESFAGIRKGPINVGGRLCLADDLGPFGSPSSDSDRCRIRDETARVLFLIYAPADYEGDLLAKATALTDNFERFNGGRAEAARLLTA